MNKLFAVFVCAIFSSGVSAQGTQNLVLEKVYMKWLVDSSPVLKSPSTFCWNLSDLVLEGENLPSLKINTAGPQVALDLDIGKTHPDCQLVGQGESWSVEKSSDTRIELSIDVSLPFSRIAMEDNRGRKIELLVEARFSELQESDFLSFFRDSTFSIRGAAIRNEVWQIPFLLTKYELPTLLSGHLALQISLGQSLFDFSGAGLRQGYYELALATPIWGSAIPFEDRISLRLRLAYEGLQVNDEDGIGIYPLLASQMVGGGMESYFAFNPQWGAQVLLNYYISNTNNTSLSKLSTEGSVSYALSNRWRLEAGMKYVNLNVGGGTVPEGSGFSEYTYFVGINVKPYLDSN